MTDRPIIFRAPMIRALLDGRKTQTRRLLKPQPWFSMTAIWHWEPGGKRPWCSWHDGPPYIPISDALAMDNAPCTIGDRLWVRETFGECPFHVPPSEIYSSTKSAALIFGMETSEPNAFYIYCYRATDPAPSEVKWRPSIHMPRAASRLTLEVTGVKVERLQEISEEDAIAEGIGDSALGQQMPKIMFHALWNSIHGPGAWDANPWVYALTFNVEKQ